MDKQQITQIISTFHPSGYRPVWIIVERVHLCQVALRQVTLLTIELQSASD